MSNRTLSPPRKSIIKATHDLVFKRVHESQLIYNTAWEDPRIDRHLLRLDAQSRVVMITSAGCNALDYLLDDPAEIHAVDMNFRQNAVLDLKQALLRQGDHEALFELFGHGATQRYQALYARVRDDLQDYSQRFWDANINYFSPTNLKPSFYFQGTAGTVAWVMWRALFRARQPLADTALQLLEAQSLAEQAELYRRIEPEIWGSLTNWLVRQPALMAMLGVPRPQIRLIETEYPGGLTSFVRDKIKRVLTEVPIADNYFWRVYMTGCYRPNCCPSYLRPKKMLTLAERSPRLKAYNTTLSNFLREHPGHYTHFVLLDHQDWLAAHDPLALREEWELLLQNSAPGAKVLMRSAGLNVDFIPEDILERLRFYPSITEDLQNQDRVGTYASTHFAKVL